MTTQSNNPPKNESNVEKLAHEVEKLLNMGAKISQLAKSGGESRSDNLIRSGNIYDQHETIDLAEKYKNKSKLLAAKLREENIPKTASNLEKITEHPAFDHFLSGRANSATTFDDFGRAIITTKKSMEKESFLPIDLDDELKTAQELTENQTLDNKVRQKKPKRLKRIAADNARPLTPKQVEVVERYADNLGDIAKTARHLGITYKACQDRLKAAEKKMGKKLIEQAVSKMPKTQALPTDHRGQTYLSKKDDQRKTTYDQE